MGYLRAALGSLVPKRKTGENGLLDGLLATNGNGKSNGNNGYSAAHSEEPLMYATMLDPRELAAFGASAIAMAVALNREALLGWDAARSFQVLYATTLAVEFAIWTDEFCGHVDWLNSSKFTDRRGLGKWASPFYGIVGAPQLSTGRFALVLLTLVATLLGAAFVTELMPVAYLLSCLVMAHLFWNRQNIGGHGGLPVLHTLFCLSLQAKGNEALVRVAIQVILAASYLASALCKLVTSLLIQRPRQWWGHGEGLKFYLLDSVSVRPMRGIRRFVRAGILEAGNGLRPLCDAAMNGALLFELLVPLLIIYYARWAGASLYAFHYMVWFLFDIDFLSFWGPSLLALAVESPGLRSPVGITEVLTDAWDAAPVRTAVLLAYVFFQVLVSLSVYDLNPRRGEVLPFSAYPMFEEATRMFQESQAMALVLRVPTAVPMAEPYYLRMQALTAPGTSKFLAGPDVLTAVGQRVLVVGIPRQAEPNPQPQEYTGGVWRPTPKPGNRLHSCATGIATMCGVVARVADCTPACLDAGGSHALNHERECNAEAGQGAVILVGNVDAAPAMQQVEQLLHMLVSMSPADAWRPDRMRELLRAYDDAEAALQLCPHVGTPFRHEFFLQQPASRSGSVQVTE